MWGNPKQMSRDPSGGDLAGCMVGRGVKRSGVSPNLTGRILLWCRGEQEVEDSRRKQQGQALPKPFQLCTARLQGCSGCLGLWLLNSQGCAPLAGHKSPANPPSLPCSGSPL